MLTTKGEETERGENTRGTGRKKTDLLRRYDLGSSKQRIMGRKVSRTQKFCEKASGRDRVFVD